MFLHHPIRNLRRRSWHQILPLVPELNNIILIREKLTYHAKFHRENLRNITMKIKIERKTTIMFKWKAEFVADVILKRNEIIKLDFIISVGSKITMLF